MMCKMQSLVNTSFSKEIGDKHGISPVEVAAAPLKAMEEERYEICVGDTVQISELSLRSPQEALMA